MTTELQRVMARYEDARIQYKKAVLASLHGDSTGEAIRAAIRDFQQASAELKRVTGTPARTPARPPMAAHPARPVRAANRPQGALAGFGFFRRLLNAG